jgi:hypothetical protein
MGSWWHARDSVPGREIIFLLHIVHIVCGTNQASCSVCTVVTFQVGLWQRRKADHSPLFNDEVKKSTSKWHGA